MEDSTLRSHRNHIWFASPENRQKRIRSFMAKVTKLANGCWIYDGAVNPDGYRMVSYRKPDGRLTTMVAHRWAFLVFVGDIEGANQIDQTCRNEACVAPKCLEQVTRGINIARGHARQRASGLKPRSYVRLAGLSRQERICARVVEDGVHWLWTGPKIRNGYGITQTPEGKSTTAHREAYMAFVGEIPEGYEVNQKCRIRLCVAPGCLEAITLAANRAHRSASSDQMCSRGHERALYSKRNSQGAWACVLCTREVIALDPTATRRTCTRCGKPGHNRRTCVNV